MAVRFDADTEEYTRASNLGTVTQYAITCWLKITVDRNAFSTAWCIDNGFAGDFVALNAITDGTTFVISNDDQPNQTLGAATVGTWYFTGLAVNGSNAVAIMQAATASTPTVVTWSNAGLSTNIVNLRIGDSVFNGEFLNGCVAAFKFWTGVALSQADLEAEAWTYLPRRTSNLRGWYPFLRAETTDYSGLNQTLSGGTGTSTEDGPPITWGGSRQRTVIQATSLQAVLDGTLPPLTSTASGTVEASGALAAALPPLTGQASGQATARGTAAGTLPPLTASAAGAVHAPGLLDATLPALTADLTGEVTGGFLDPVLPALTADMTGAATATGGTAGLLPALAADLAGQVVIPPHDITVTAGQARRSWASGALTRPWAAGGTATRWTAGPPVRAWATAETGRRWAARQPTT